MIRTWGKAGVSAAIAGLLALSMAGCGKKEVTGKWEGQLDLGSVAPQLAAKSGGKLRLILKFDKNSEGKLYGTLDSPDQKASGIGLDKVQFKDDKLHFEVPMVAASFDGSLNKDGNELSGTFHQGPLSLPLTLKKTT